MNLGVEVVAFILGAVFSLLASGMLVARLERFAQRFSLTEAALGLLAALAADAPEITSSVSALLHHDTSVGVGVVVGSNLFNIAALIGLAALVASPLRLPRSVTIVEGVPAIAIAIVCALALDRLLHPVASLALLLVITLVVVVIAVLGPVRVGRKLAIERYVSTALSEESSELYDLFEPLVPRRGDALIALIALGVVIGASAVMEQTAVSLGHRFQIAPAIVGGVVLAAVTSIPNAVAALYLARRRRPAALLAEASNSNTLNVVFGFALPAVLIGTGRLGSMDAGIGLWYLGLTVVAYAVIAMQKGMRRPLGAAVILGYAAYIVYALKR